MTYFVVVEQSNGEDVLRAEFNTLEEATEEIRKLQRSMPIGDGSVSVFVGIRKQRFFFSGRSGSC